MLDGERMEKGGRLGRIELFACLARPGVPVMHLVQQKRGVSLQ